MPKSILIVEDDADSREVLSLILRAEGFSVLTAEDGQQALELVNDAPPDLVITDIQMPNIDGIEFIKRMRAQFESKSVPIVVMSAFGSGITRDALKAGADRSTPKPMHVRSLLNLIKQLLG